MRGIATLFLMIRRIQCDVRGLVAKVVALSNQVQAQNAALQTIIQNQATEIELLKQIVAEVTPPPAPLAFSQKIVFGQPQ